MILTDREIRLALRAGRIVIKPEPDTDLLSATSVDLTLHQNIRRWIGPLEGVDLRLAPDRPGYSYSEVHQRLTEHVEPVEGGFTINPGDFLLAWTAEYVELPVEHGIAARVEGRSSLGRIGIAVHVTAPIVHAGFKGQIQLEICNHGPNPVTLTPLPAHLRADDGHA